MSTTDTCATCLAMANRDFRGLPTSQAIEVAHISGMVVGIVIAGGHSVAEARQFVAQTFCEEHATDLVRAAGYFHDRSRPD